MFQSYLKTALRFVRRQKGYAVINILGLAVGLACSFLILLWVQDELRFDRFHEDGDRLFIAKRHAYFTDGQVFTWDAITKPVSRVLEEQYPEVEDAEMVTFQNSVVVAAGELAYREDGYWADDAFFEMFTFPLLAGDPATAIDEPDAIVISEALAAKLFAGVAPRDVLGRTVRIDDRADFRVTGVSAAVPEYSTLQFDFILPAEEYYARNEWVEHWGNSGMQLFVRLVPGADYEALNAKIKNIIREHHEGSEADVFLQPYEDMRLYGDFDNAQPAGGRIDFVRAFVVVAAFILLIACINFMNLATARAAKRAREIGVRKSVGATRGALVSQFLGESLVMAFLAFALALVFVLAALPGFNALTDKAIGLGDIGGGPVGLFFAIAAVTGLVAGSYPALYLSSFNVVGVLRGGGTGRSGHAALRKGLVVFQFALSILLVIGTLTIYRQVDYIRTKDLGLDKENLVFTSLEGPLRAQYDAARAELLRRPGIVSVTASSQNPLSVGSSTTDPEWDGKDPDADILFSIINSRYDFIETMGMELAAGRTFSPEFGADSANFIVNERAVQVMGMTDPIGQRLAMWNREGQIIGVVKDFHMASLHNEIGPTIIRLDPESTWMLFARFAPGATTEGLASLEAVHGQFNPSYPFEYQFLDDRFEQTYETERMIGRLANAFAVLAVFVACLGLFGLASYTAEQRTKEVGIRKVLGAGVASLVVLLSRDFVRLVVVAFVIAAPIAYVLMDRLLSTFTYHTSVGVAVFVAAGMGAFVVAAVTVGAQSFRAAVADPVRSLRSE